jgi:hypothetical protein
VVEHVADAVAAVNSSEPKLRKQVVPKFYDIHSLDGNTQDGRVLLRRLRISGCIVIVDAISLRHPIILRAYQRSMLDVFPSTYVLTLTPDAGALQLMHNMVYALQINLQESEFRLRCRDPLEGLNCRANNDLDSVVGWLYERVQKHATKLLAAEPSPKGSRMQLG